MSLPSSRPRIVLTTARSLAIVTVAYVGAACGASVLFRYVAEVRGVDGVRPNLVTAAFAVVMAALWLYSVIVITRSRS